MSCAMKRPAVVTDILALRAATADWRVSHQRIGLVPTMGALHEGHLSLVRETQRHAERVIVSIFVNPAQFAPHEDFDRYPRNLETDLDKLASTSGVDLVFSPSVGVMYPDGFATRIEVDGPAKGLETDFRPHFFAGVATVVAKLLIAAMPDIAVFGEKDYQQLLVVRRLAADLCLPVLIHGASIVREADGLAMSSRNAYLTSNERKIASKLNRVLREVIARAKAGAAIAEVEDFGVTALCDAGFASVDYVALRDAQTLTPIADLGRPARVLAAARIGATRLIDNMSV